ncbi:unnamed protein product [Ilex paraguariensis]|uniref:Uncharacterized protein n=1 Tax=Ilex paraguariensis TaxID=185542 RepID=A0ABC8SEC3_9AQUA
MQDQDLDAQLIVKTRDFSLKELSSRIGSTYRWKSALSDHELNLHTVEPVKIAQGEYMGNKAKEHVIKEITPEESDLAHRSEALEERVDTGLAMAVIEGDFFSDKQMTPNKNVRATNPQIRGEPKKSSKSKRLGAGAMT